MDWKKFLKDLGFEGSSNNLPTTGDLKKQWKRKVRETHPDTGGDPKEFRKVMHAYKMLTDAEYVNAQNKGPDQAEKLIIINHIITFERSFFGGKQFLSWARINLSDSHTPIPSEGESVDLASIEFDIPPGTQSGHQIMFPGKGHKYGAEFGDAKLIINVQPHQKFRYGKNGEVHSVELIPLDKMLRGLEIEIPTMYGLETVKLKPGSKPGDTFKIPKCGVSKEGDHIITVQPLFPTEKDLKGNEWSGLKIDWEPVPPSPEEEAYIKHAEDIYRQMMGGFGIRPEDLE